MEKQCLILGPQNTGKTLLIKRIQTMSSDKSACDTLPPPTQPTTGTTLVTIATPHGPLLLKEYGGKMAPLWHKALAKADMYIFVVDASNPWQLGVATVLLMETLSHEATRDKPVLLLFNKSDTNKSSSSSTVSLEECKTITRVSDLKAKYQDLLSVVDGNCLSCTGIDYVIQWLMENRQKLNYQYIK